MFHICKIKEHSTLIAVTSNLREKLLKRSNSAFLGGEILRTKPQHIHESQFKYDKKTFLDMKLTTRAQLPAYQ